MKKELELYSKNPKTKQNERTGTLKFNSTSEEKAELYFYGDIVSDTWQSYWYEEDKCPQDIADFLNGLDNYKAIDIYINSGGGSVHAGLAIYNQLKRYAGEKIVHVDGLAASIASVIAMAGDKVIVPSTAQIMIHKPWSSLWGGNADDFRREADALDSCQKAITAVYMENVKDGVTEGDITDMVNKETWLTGEEAEKYFNIEVEQTGNIAACTSSFFDKYKNTPKEFKKNTENKIEIDYDKMADSLIKRLQDSEKLKIEEEKAKILEDLDYI